ncbi:MAG: ABC transporter ATP-binding protein [Bacteroidales bacterium]|nr:ABC transporter ATP-binding protein [Bacteroidales bacterium]
MIKIEGIEKTFGAVKVLKGIDVELPDKKVIAIVGPSGAGKTTLLQIMGTLSSADKGRVIINGHDVSQLNQQQMARFRNQHIGFVFQFHHLLPEFSAIENVAMPALIGGQSLSEASVRARELLSFLGLSHREQHRPSEMSGGEQQRVAVARALMNRPDVVFADEPSGNLDTQNKNELHRLFFRLRDEMGQTFVVVTHDPELAQMADITITMSDGRIV